MPNINRLDAGLTCHLRRHLYALYCLLQREINSPLPTPDPNGSGTSTSTGTPSKSLPSMFTDHGWSVLNTSILSTSNCGNPALRLFGFGPVAADGYGIGYIIKEEGISVCASSKHLQTRRFLDTLENYLVEVHRMVTHLHRAANERPTLPEVSVAPRNSSMLRRVPSTRVVVGGAEDAGEDEAAGDDEVITSGYSFFDSVRGLFVGLCLWLI
jgi:carnitine O-acetyltransferase